MEIVIDIDDKTYKEVCWRGLALCSRGEANLVKAIKNCKPLPEHHGRLIDANELYGDFIDGTEGYDCQTWNRIEIGDIIDDAPTIIEGSDNNDE